MNVTPEQREQVRLSLLRYGLGFFTLGLAVSYLRSEGLGLDRDQMRMEIGYLEDKGFLKVMQKEISPENKLWATTASGRDYLAERGVES